jgi:hypothetical protein
VILGVFIRVGLNACWFVEVGGASEKGGFKIFRGADHVASENLRWGVGPLPGWMVDEKLGEGG